MTTQSFANAELRGAPYEAFAFNNILINGGTEVDQANAGAAVALASGTSKYIADEWSALFISSGAAFSAQQGSSAPAGYQINVQLKATTAITSVAAGDLANFN